MRRAWLVALGAALACGGSHQEAPGGGAAAGTPVAVALVRRATLPVTVSGPGRTDAVRVVHVRAPFTGTLVALRVTDGDRVDSGAVLGTLVARNSEAAVTGAQAMVAAARSPADTVDARRALALAERALVRRAITAPVTGLVVSHTANQGDLVNEDGDLLTIAAAGTVVFLADIPQPDLPRVRPGQRATVELTAGTTPLAGVVHAILPSASSDNLTAPVRVDFAGPGAPSTLGLFGAAHIVVGTVRDAVVVPEAALLRDDVYGTTRLAVVTPGGLGAQGGRGGRGGGRAGSR